MHHPTDRITHTTAFVTPVMEHWLEREIVQWSTWIDLMTHRTIICRHYQYLLSTLSITKYWLFGIEILNDSYIKTQCKEL